MHARLPRLGRGFLGAEVERDVRVVEHRRAEVLRILRELLQQEAADAVVIGRPHALELGVQRGLVLLQQI